MIFAFLPQYVLPAYAPKYAMYRLYNFLFTSSPNLYWERKIVQQRNDPQQQNYSQTFSKVSYKPLKVGLLLPKNDPEMPWTAPAPRTSACGQMFLSFLQKLFLKFHEQGNLYNKSVNMYEISQIYFHKLQKSELQRAQKSTYRKMLWIFDIDTVLALP